MLVSVLVPNYNYARFLPAALDSALNQTYPKVEVIVVDDGSTDESGEVIAAYGDRVVAARQANGGLTAAVNTAFARSRGEIICLLDADDVFAANKVARVVEAVRRVPEAQLVHHQMQTINGAGRPLHAPFPRHVPDGDLRQRILRTGGWFPHPVLSGLCFTRAYAERLFPIPLQQEYREDDAVYRFPVFPDTYLAGPAALLAPIIGIQAPLTLYRLHGTNMSFSTQRSSQAQLMRFKAEAATLTAVMNDTFGQSVALGMDNHLDWQLLRCAAGETSRARTVGRVMRSPCLPLTDRLREAARAAANRGLAARHC